MTTIYKNADQPFNCTQAQADMLDRLAAMGKGRIGSIKGYRPSTGVVVQPVYDMQVITRIETSKLYARKKAALESITFGQIAEDIAKHPKLAALSTKDALDQFNASRDAAIASIEKTQDGDRSDAHRQGHDRCYARVADGVKVNFVTEKVNGLQQPVLTNGIPTLASIMLTVLELNRTTIVEGEYKVVNSGPKVLMDKIIEKHMNMRSVGIKTVSLKEDNFDSFNVSGQTITPADIQTVEITKSKLVALLEAAGFSSEAALLAESL